MSTAAATREEIARLFGRAAFGATAADIDAWTGRPWPDAVSALIDIAAPAGRGVQGDDAQRVTIERAGQNNTDVGAIRLAQKWWLERMRTGRYPLEERMTLFWHGHFATAVRYPFPDVAMIMGQNETIRRQALGNFRTLLRDVTLDPAMMEWLDGARNSIPAPNENYARELLELFTLGKFPQVYSETDVREAARVLTGWTTDTGFRRVAFNPAGHDNGAKTVLGTTIGDGGSAEYQRLLDVALAQPVSPRFIAAKLVANFAYAPDLSNLLTRPDPLVAAVADTLHRSDWDLRAAMRTLLLSDEFRIGDAGRQRVLVRQPAELAAAAGKALGVSLNNDNVVYALARMNQELFVPPNVGGFPSGLGWMSPSTVLGRYELGVAIHNLNPGNLPASGDFEGWARRLGLATLSSETRAAVGGYLAESAKSAEDTKRSSVLLLLLSSPDWAVL
ncbi:MAG TPA: DUF1800 domain-containing protein [Acidimicrobiales bacterium]|nr:DUF1800 domain-containing protein [Acidimicrobiales bacterium]